ncbi:MAG: hypothetical protein NVS1B10_08100 [Candidatus Saccharimonadales bacterium]
MGNILNFTDSYGKNFPTAYAKIAQISLEKDKGGIVVFNLYATQADAGNRVIASKTYSVAPAQFTTYFSPIATGEHWGQAYALSYNTADTDFGNKDALGNPVKNSFFKGATNSDTGLPVTTV